MKEQWLQSACVANSTEYLGRKDTSVAQFRYVRDNQYGATSHIKKMSNTMFVHEIAEAHRNLHK